MKKSFSHLETKIIHAGEPRLSGAVSMPIFQTAMFAFEGETSYHDLRYIRLNNTPNHTALHEKLAALENAEAALVTSSGMSAISTSLLTFLQAGDHLLAQRCLYGGTHDLLAKDLANLGILCDFIDADKPETWAQKCKPETKVIYVEAMTNPLVEVGDLIAVARFAKERRLISMIDNTFCTPVNFRPLEHGFDLSLHSCTKYLNGHSDLVAGAVIGHKALIEQIKKKLDHFGGSLDPHAAYLLHRGIKTLFVRVKHQNESALQISRFLEKQPEVAKVNYAGLESSKGHHYAKKLFGGFGGVLSFELKGGAAAAQRLIQATTLPLKAPSLGGVETLITQPALTSHAGLSIEERHQLGILDGLIRVSVGLESTEELIADFERALRA